MDSDELQFLYNENQVKFELRFYDHLNSFDKEEKVMNILEYEIRKLIMSNSDINIEVKDKICPKSFESCRIAFKDYKIKLFWCRNGHEINDILLHEFNDTQIINQKLCVIIVK